MKYGLNYQGSKNPIVEEMCDLFPKKTNFYDLFMGGGAVTHRMLQLGTFERYFASDINKMPVNLFANCFYGDIPDPRWVEREDFEALKTSNPYVACCYSFGGDWSSYLYSKEKEPIQRALHLAVVDDDFTETNKLGIDIEYLTAFNSWRSRRLVLLAEGYRLIELERMEQLIAISKLKHPKSILFVDWPYDNWEIRPDSVVYCDPPYKDTKGYVAKGFDHEKFYDWCRCQRELTFISEYTMPDDFICIREFTRLEAKSAYKASNVVERLFIPRHQEELYHTNKTTLF